MNRPPLRKHDEIQWAHDTLVSLLLGPEEILHRIVDEDKIDQVTVAVDVLCWVLHHNHNHNFATNLSDVERFMKEEGLEMREMPEGN